MQILKCVLFLTMLSTSMTGQIIQLENPSFEGEARDAVMPLNWHACSEGTTPDLLPGPWGVYNEPSDGDTYLGLITRENFSWEVIGQRLREPLVKGNCYVFALDLSHSDLYSGYNNPIKLRIWAGKNKCDKGQLISETDFIRHTEWKTYEFKFNAEQKMNYIILEAFYRERPYAHKGNILIDNIAPIRLCGRA